MLTDDLELEPRGRRVSDDPRDMKTLLAGAAHHDVMREAKEELEAISKSRLYRRPHHQKTGKKNEEVSSRSGSTVDSKMMPPVDHSSNRHVEL